MNTVGIVTARMGSTRLPGKALLPICGRPLIRRLLDRLSRATRLDQIVVAVPDTPENHRLADYVEESQYAVYRGDEFDVLDRVYSAAVHYQADHIVLITGDCPLIDPVLVDQTVGIFLAAGYDFMSNAWHPTFPDGLDTAVFTMKLLEQTWKYAKAASEREHVTLWMKTVPIPSFIRGSFTGTPDRSHLRWCVDEPRDLAFVEAIYTRLYPANHAFTSQDIYDLLEREPELLKINAGIERNEGLRKSLEDEQ